MHPWLEYESGHAWCESSYSKYETVHFVAEFANTITNLPIVILPLVNAYMMREYIQRTNWIIILPHLLLAFNGLASTYYHATLNLFGQLVDELSILWMLNIAFVAYLPVMKLFRRFERHVNGIRWGVVALTTAISALCFMKPSINAFALMTFSIPSAAVLHYEGSNADNAETRGFLRRTFILWTLAMSFWFSDRLLCDFWIFLRMPYLHAVFHLFSSVAAYNAFLMLSLIDIQRRCAAPSSTNTTTSPSSLANHHTSTSMKTNGHCNIGNGNVKGKGKNFVAEIGYFPFPNSTRLSLPYIRLRDASGHLE